MTRQRTLAEILADDTGNIRPEVADLLMEPDQPRGQIQPVQSRFHHAAQVIDRPVPNQWPPIQGQPLSSGLIAFGLAILTVLITLVVRQDLNSSAQAHHEVKAAVSGATVQPLVKTEKVEDSIPAKQNLNTQVTYPAMVLREGFNIREKPSAQGETIKRVEEGEILNVLSFKDGWYKVVLDERIGYIFGVYILLPRDSEFLQQQSDYSPSQWQTLQQPQRHFETEVNGNQDVLGKHLEGDMRDDTSRDRECDHQGFGNKKRPSETNERGYQVLWGSPGPVPEDI